MNNNNYVEEEIGKIKRIRCKTFGEKLGEFLGGCFVVFLILAFIGALIDDDKDTNKTVKSNNEKTYTPYKYVP